MLFFKKLQKQQCLRAIWLRAYTIYDVLGTILSGLHRLTQICASFMTYPHNFNLINSGLPVRDLYLSPRPAIYFLYNIRQITSFPRVLIHHLSNSKGSIYNVNLGCSFHENKYKAFHEMPGKCETVNSLASPLSYYLLYISWNRNHLFLYCILRAWHITCNQHLLRKINEYLN